jgi:hypothetical protein
MPFPNIDELGCLVEVALEEILHIIDLVIIKRIGKLLLTKWQHRLVEVEVGWKM